MNWIDTTVGEFCPFTYGKGLPKTKRQAGEYPVYGSNGCVDFHNDFYINGPGIIIGRKGSVGAVHLSTQPFWPIDTAFYVTKGTLGELRFTYYLLKSLGLEKMNSDSAVPGLNRDNAHALSIRIPESPESRESLGNQMALLDEKIAANSGVNQTLEDMAQAIFKSWFVDFDPVKAKMNGEQPEGMDAATASLFPEKLFESELGLIPEGWEVGELTELAKLDTTSVKPNKEPETIWEHYSIPAFDDGYHPSFDTGESIKSNKYKVKANAVLVSKLNPRFQRIWLPLPEDTDKAICSTEFMQFVPSVPTLKPYLYSLVKSSPFQSELLNTVTGTTGSRQRAQPKQVAKARIVVPPVELMAIYSEKVDSILTMTQKNIRQSIELAKLRDTLLPKLLSGEIELETK
ncbi:restriction endonuclease subunit S [Vibrio owensii]|uniref:restriction endonuclease subunit S n=1 Tax=Vibrio owensii TaxID=696485 RepID=UPI003DA043EF